MHVFRFYIVDPPRITSHPQELKHAVQEETINFIIEATGTEPLSYQWQWMSAREENWGEGWQLCPVGWCDGAKLMIPSIQKSNEGSYRCVISNCAGTQTSNPATLSVGKNPIISVSRVCVTPTFLFFLLLLLLFLLLFPV